uniref:Reverse transcriptase domain-containing protein n=1 Tax=Tanacetum cinerariifolium TaxID=118510 RepID=A0A6L2LBT3_TANCI|nr:reverse transcriptase domain-containing protein [Tanacetum cinerariifolium]
METIPDEEDVAIDAIPLAVKSPRIVDWKIHKEGKKSYYQIGRADGKSQMYMIFSQMLKSFDRKDLEDLYKLLKARYGSTRPVESMDYLLLSDMKIMFEPHVEDEERKLQKDTKCWNRSQGKVKFLIMAIDYFTKWIEAKPVATITSNQTKKFMWDNIVCRFRLPGDIILDNGKQFWDNPFKDWCEKLCIHQHFDSVKHPETDGLVERANCSLGEGIKARLDVRSKNWMVELPHVL